MQVHASARIEIKCNVLRVFDYATDPATLAKVFVGYGAIPAITRAEMVDGALPERGAKRLVVNSDGSQLIEEILAFDRPRQHSYRIVSGLRMPFSLLIRSGDGDWRFFEDKGSTEVRWDYAFELTSVVAWPAAAALMRLQFVHAMQRALNRIRTHLEAAHT
jgi:Polyketide cyclase / dehydrase and lipid transport